MNIHKTINITIIVSIAMVFSFGAYAATRAIVPRADTEGSIGTAAKQWGGVYGVEAYISALTDHGVVVGGGTGALDTLAVGTNGQVLVGSTGADPVFATITAGDSLTATLGAGTLEFDVDDDFIKLAGDAGMTNVFDSATTSCKLKWDLVYDNTTVEDQLTSKVVGWGMYYYD